VDPDESKNRANAGNKSFAEGSDERVTPFPDLLVVGRNKHVKPGVRRIVQKICFSGLFLLPCSTA